jgi:dephospho-CoA kinase
MRRVALTGGIATGKSHVLARLAARGVPVIDADRLAREALEPGTAAWQAVRRRFGESVIGQDGEIDRRRLAAVVFGDVEARRDLEQIVHPRVYEGIRRWFGGLPAAGEVPYAVAEIPLLYETARSADFDKVIVTVCDPGDQIRRVMARDGLSEEAARRRLEAQWPAAAKARRGDFVIDTSGPAEQTDRRVEEVHQALSSA